MSVYKKRNNKNYINKLSCIVVLLLVLLYLTGCKVQTEDLTRGIMMEDGFHPLRKGVYTYLLLGVDTEGSLQEEKEPGLAGQSDAIYLLCCDFEKNSARLIGIPRDTMAEIEIFLPSGKENGTSVDHLTLQYAFGDGKQESCKLTSKAVSRLLYGLPIDGYLAVNLGAIPRLTDTLGGIEVTVPDDSAVMEDPAFREGEKILLTGSNVKKFLRFRNIEASQSAITRMERHKVFFKACAREIKDKVAKDPAILSYFFKDCYDEIITDLSINDLYRIVSLHLEDEISVIPGMGISGDDGYDEYYIDMEGLQKMLSQLLYAE